MIEQLQDHLLQAVLVQDIGHVFAFDGVGPVDGQFRQALIVPQLFRQVQDGLAADVGPQLIVYGIHDPNDFLVAQGQQLGFHGF